MNVKPYEKSTSTKRLGNEILQKTKELSVHGSLGNLSLTLKYIEKNTITILDKGGLYQSTLSRIQ
jgi:hypothetical protein